MSMVIAAQDVGRPGRAKKRCDVISCGVACGLIIRPYVNRQGCFCTQPCRSALMGFFIHRLQRGNQGQYSHMNSVKLKVTTNNNQIILDFFLRLNT